MQCADNMRRNGEGMEKLKDILIKILNILAGGSFIVMVVLTCWQVFTRYFLKNPSTWSEELVSYMFAWASLLGASIVTSERGHMNIPILVDHLKPAGKRVMNIFSEVVAFLFSLAILVYGGWQISNLALGQMTSSLGVPIGIFYFVMPLCGILNMIFTLINIIEIAKKSDEEVA